MDESLRFTEKMGIPADKVTFIRQTTRIIVKSSLTAQQTYSGQVMLETAANLLGRIFPHVVIETEDYPADYLKTHQPLNKYLNEIVKDAYEWVGIPENVEREFSLVVGALDVDPDSVYIDADGWMAYVGSKPNETIQESNVNIPIGAVVSACLGVSELFKRVFSEYISHEVLMVNGGIWLNTLTYTDDKQINPNINELVMDKVVLFGSGSVGSALLYTLKFMPVIRGNLDIVDRDIKVDTKNLQRYSYLTVSDVINCRGTSKAKWASRKFQSHFPDLKVTPWDEKNGEVNQYLNANTLKPGIQLAISAVDNVKARIQIADCLAKRTINAGTGDTTLSITRHGFADGKACLACSYIAKLPDVNWYQDLSNQTGLPVDRAAFVWEGNDLLNEDDVYNMRRHGFITDEQVTELVKTDLRSLVNRRLYAQIKVTDKKDDKPVTAPFVSTMAGALLAGELIKELTGLTDSWKENKYKANLLLLPTCHAMWVPIEDKGNCLCKNAFRIKKYQELWKQ